MDRATLGSLPAATVVTDNLEGIRMSDQNQNDGAKTWYEEFTVSSSELLDKVKELIEEGNVRRVFIKNSSGETLLEFPLNAGVAVTALTAAFAPMLVAVGAVAALLTSATIGVERVKAHKQVIEIDEAETPDA